MDVSMASEYLHVSRSLIYQLVSKVEETEALTTSRQ